ncbi:O-antigen ligase family protein [Nocardioides sp.]|uniref:O-antigen ligase family protein n=1 Tax=Nocardioides sp. TaxID=35761 RepID=UPI0039E6C6A8
MIATAPARPAATPTPGLPGRPESREGLRVLTAYVVILFVFPAPMLIAALGQVGGPATLAAVGCFMWWSWTLVNRAVPEPVDAGRVVRIAALVFLLVCVIAYAHSAATPYPADERSLLDAALIRMVGCIGLVCLAADGLRDAEQVWTLVTRLVYVLGAVCAIALVQSFTGEVWVDRISLPGLTPASGIEIAQRGIITRPAGTASHPIELASVLAVGMPLAFAVAGRPGARAWLRRLIAVLVAITLLLIGSRTAIVCGTVGFVAMLFAWNGRTRLIAVGASLLVLCVAFVMLPGFLGTLAGMFLGAGSDPSVASRTDSYRIVEEFWSHHLWIGRGVGTFLPKYWILDNEYLILLIGAGVLGLAALLGLILTAVAVAARAAALARRAGDDSTRQLCVAALGGTLAGAVSMALFDGFSFPQAAGMFFLCLGICGALPRAVASRMASR